MFSSPDPEKHVYVPPVPWPGKFDLVPYAPRLSGQLLQEFFSLLDAELAFRVELIESKRDQLAERDIPIDTFVPLEEAHSILRHIDLAEGAEEVTNPFPSPWLNGYWEDQIPLGGDIILAEMVEGVLGSFRDRSELSFLELTSFMKQRAPELNLLSLENAISLDQSSGLDYSDYERPDNVLAFQFSSPAEALRAGSELTVQGNFEEIFSCWQICGALNLRRESDQVRIREQIWMEAHDIFIDDLDQLFNVSTEQLLVNLWRFEVSNRVNGRASQYALLAVESAWDQTCAVGAARQGIISDLDQLLETGARWESISFKAHADRYMTASELDAFFRELVGEVAERAEASKFNFPWDSQRFCKLLGIG